MNRCVPDFDVEVDFSLPTSSDQSRHRKSSMALDEVMELLWQNGQVVMQSQNQRSVRKSPPPKLNDGAIPPEQSASREIREDDRHLFVQEDEMASWLHYPLVDDSTLDPTFCSDLLYSTPPQCVNHNANSNAAVRTSQGIELRSSVTVTAAVAQQPPVASIRRTESETKGHNVLHFARHAPIVDSGTSIKKSVVRDLTVVDSCGTLSVGLESRASEMVRAGVAEPSNDDGLGRGTVISCSPARTPAGVGGVSMGKETMTCEVTVTSSPGDSCASADPSITEKLVSDDRKRKGREAVETECHSEDVDFESGDVKKQVRGSTSSKRPRAAEVHNLSERRRRDRINEKMRALQELIPRCNKSDKASMLDEAIEYLKSLQLQVQMMSMGCGMVPMMFPGVQSYMPPMGMGMGMGMEMGLNRPMMPFPNMLAASVLPTPRGASHIGPRFPTPSFHMAMAPRNDPLKPSDHGLNTHGTPTMNQLRVPNFLDAYSQFLGPHSIQMPPTQLQLQKQPVTQLSPSKPCSSRGHENLGKHLPG